MIRFIKALYYRHKVRQGKKILEGLDDMMQGAGHSRFERRQFWRDSIKSKDNRNLVLKRLK